jgi:hypothetical protein
MKLALALAIGAVLGSIGMNIASDYAARAPGDEVARCTDEPDRVAYYARLPGEAHSVESCIRVPRYGDPAWVPVMGDVTVAGAGVRGKLGLEKQLGYVRDECRKLAKQLKQRC